ncbi:ABC transporter related protein [Xylanimonas cellulosilytica DSM 15894]|uniref:ABC transporter related protein n=1 Tax=Xylanimonas cellulosilytica (strain DSM 15894 / JCM 12276 / CECT 5975 / KCTC 9989 / LMG 20990 / NBRC 107835 / XIL07) TaxID=446471 RepID=D1BYE6_XYLCX|nr:ATP-binding cassette domain-containing protein [Xylanimonas cellulosilytica]ACZ31818.1 ABC transporter related protein [Xylanimonas cellulosilytica DSM 15894]
MTQPATPTLADLRAQADARQAPAGQDGDALVVCEGLVRIYRREGVEVVALQGLDLQVRRGELIAVVGASGSGKSTLLGILSGLDQPTAGAVTVAGRNLLTMTPAQRLDYRRSTVGFVFQQTGANLLPYLTAAENVALPLRATGVRAPARRARAAELLSVLGLADHANRRADQLSGGQQQRVAIAVALANDPELVLADEPTGELDSATAAEVYDAFARVNAELGVTVVIVTHDPAVADTVDRTVAIRDGRTASEVLRGPASATAPRTVREYAVLDRAGRLQLPHELVAALGLHQRVRLELAGDHIRIWPAERASSAASASSSGAIGEPPGGAASSGAVGQPGGGAASSGGPDDGEDHHGRHVKGSDG